MSKLSGRWLLVEWGDGNSSVVNVRALVDGDRELKVDDEVVIGRRGGRTRRGKLVNVSDDRAWLQQQVITITAEPEPTPRLYDEPDPGAGDFSASDSEWGPDSPDSSDSEKETQSKRIKIEAIKKQYSNRSIKKSRTPTLRAEAVIPASMHTNNANQSLGHAKVKKRKLQEARRSLPVEQAIPDSTRSQSKPRKRPQGAIPNGNITVSAEEFAKVKRDLSEFRNMLKLIKDTVASLRTTINPDHLYETVYASVTPSKEIPRPPEVNDEELVEVIVPEPEEIVEPVKVLREAMKLAKIVKPVKYGLIKHNSSKADAVVEKANTHIGTKRPASNQTTNSSDSPAHASIINDEMVPIGSGKTMVPKYVYSKIKWDSYTAATRKLLMTVFPRRILATHSLTGKQSPAFADRPAKLCLDQKKVTDIIMTVTRNCNVKERLVRAAITTKCADENKMLRMRSKIQKTKEAGSTPFRILNNQENLPPENAKR
ncbi:uncharacterized protein LOC105380030 [Plutella xylostella]|uniref:uncharacterized protein LOC105380030 n=1 Tax=Plutella xylostella TaxID=51655 RepID=UPI0020327A07|nr:uncharacterized protein LOC105380030 [Plutella xylostella]